MYWDAAGSRCTQAACHPNTPLGYCAPGHICVSGTCKPFGCNTLSVDGCSTCATSGTTDVALSTPAATPPTPPPPAATTYPNCDDCDTSKSVCINGAASGPACVPFQDTCAFVYDNKLDVPDWKPPEAFEECGTHQAHYVCDYKGGNFGPSCTCGGAAKSCNSICGTNTEHPGMLPGQCPPGYNCPGVGLTCTINSNNTCPTGYAPSGKKCLCVDTDCAGSAATLMNSVLHQLDGCPSYFPDNPHMPKNCYFNAVSQDITAPGTVNPEGTTTITKGSSLIQQFPPGAVIQFDRTALSNTPQLGILFLGQSFTGLPKQTNLQVLMAYEDQVATITPQMCMPARVEGGAPGPCEQLGGGLPCEPGSVPVRITPWMETKNFQKPGKTAFPPYFSVWSCQTHYGQCWPGYSPQIVEVDGHITYGCTRNPVPNVEVCKNHLTMFYGDCVATGACDWSKVLTDSQFSFDSSSCGGKHISRTTACNPGTRGRQAAIQDNLYNTLVPPGHIYPNAVSLNAYTWAKANNAKTKYPICKYMMSQYTANNAGQPVWNALQEWCE